MKICTGRKTSYLNGMTFENCKLIAEEITEKIKPEIKQNGKMLWSELLEKANRVNL